MKRLALLAVVALVVTGSIGVVLAEPDGPAAECKVVGKIKIGGEGRWDFVTVDTAGHRLFVPRSSHVIVLDLTKEDLKQVGDIADTKGVHGVALAPEVGRGFTSNGGDNSVTIFDLKSLAVLGKVKTGDGPDAILYSPTSHRVFVMNHKGGTITTFPADIDPAKPADPQTIEVGGALECAAEDGAGHLYVNVEDKSQTVAIDIATLKVTDRWALGEGKEPTGLAMDAKKGLLFAGCGNEKMVVLDSHSGHVVATLPIGQRVDGCAFDSDRELAFASNGDGTLTVVGDHDAAHPAVAYTVKTQPGAKTIAIDPSTHRLYLPTADFAAAAEGKKSGRPAMVADSFTILVVE